MDEFVDFLEGWKRGLQLIQYRVAGPKWGRVMGEGVGGVNGGEKTGYNLNFYFYLQLNCQMFLSCLLEYRVLTFIQ